MTPKMHFASSYSLFLHISGPVDPNDEEQIYICIFVSEPTKNEGMHMCYLGFILFHQFLTLFEVIISFSEGRFRGSQWENPNI